MKLTTEEAKKILLAPACKVEIQSVKEQESQLRVFTEELDKTELGRERYWSYLQQQMKARSNKKFDRVLTFARYPLPVIQITDSILTDFYKVFEGKNRSFNVDGDRDLSVLKKWIDENDVEGWIEKYARQVLKNKPCSFVVIDKDTNGKPYLVFVDSDRLIDAQFKNKKGDLEYIAFIHSITQDETGRKVTKFAVYDEERYFVFEKDDAGNQILVQDTPHNLGFCPARAFISEQTNSENPFKRRTAFSGALSKLEDWTMFDIYRNYVDHYAPFPVTEAPKKKCPNPDCDNGVVKTEVVPDLSNPVNVEYKWGKCPVCGDNEDSLIFPGTHIGIQVKADKSLNDGSGVFKMIFPETDKMNYVPEKLGDLELEIRHKTVGLNFMESINEAINQMQLKGSFASMESVLLRTKAELDSLYKWIVTSVAKMMYKDIRVQVDANFGTEFYLVSEDDLQKRFENAKKIGLPQEEQMMIYSQLIETKYKGNPNKVDRQKMLLKLDPLPLYSVQEVIQMAEKNLIDTETLSLKINLINFVTKFELENAPITQFGNALPLEKRLEVIRGELNRYNAEQVKKIGTPTSTEGQNV